MACQRTGTKTQDAPDSGRPDQIAGEKREKTKTRKNERAKIKNPPEYEAKWMGREGKMISRKKIGETRWQNESEGKQTENGNRKEKRSRTGICAATRG